MSPNLLSEHGVTPEQQLAIGRFLSDPATGAAIIRVLDRIYEKTGGAILESFDGHAAAGPKRTAQEIADCAESAYDERRAVAYAREFIGLFVQAPGMGEEGSGKG